MIELHPGAVYGLELGIVNAYLIDDGEVTLVDAGTPGSVDRLRGELDSAGYVVDDVDRLLITHFDLDHVGGLAALERSGAIHAMEPDASFIEGTRSPPLGNHKGLLQRLMGIRSRPPTSSVERIEDGDSVGGFTAYHTPGHSPGHCVFHHPGLDLAILGDLVRETDGALTTAPWILAYSTGENAASVRRLVDLTLNFEIAAVGHGTPLASGGAEALAALAGRLR